MKKGNKVVVFQDEQTSQEVVQEEQTPQQTEVLTGDQVIIGTGGNLEAGREYTVSADTAMVLINKGIATLKTK